MEPRYWFDVVMGVFYDGEKIMSGGEAAGRLNTLEEQLAKAKLDAYIEILSLVADRDDATTGDSQQAIGERYGYQWVFSELDKRISDMSKGGKS